MKRPAIAIWLALAACSSGSTSDSGIGPRVEVGVGRAFFTPITDGQLVELESGPQGGGRLSGHHIWTSVYFEGLAVESVARIDIVLTSSDGVEQARIVRAPSDTELEPCEAGQCLLGMAPRILDCCAVAEQSFELRAVLSPVQGEVLEDARIVMGSKCPVRGEDVCLE